MPPDVDNLFSVLLTHQVARANAPAPGTFDEEVVWLCTDLWTSYYLTRDWRIFTTDAIEPSARPRIASARGHSGALVLGARNLDAPQLLSLLPPRPASARDCRRCGGERWSSLGQSGKQICSDCNGKGL
jgi:hypothetical protein